MRESTVESIKDAFCDVLPIVAGVIPFGVTWGIVGLSSGLTILETIMMSVLVFAGASQFISLAMITNGSCGLGIISLTTALVNLRHLIMGASLAPHLLKQNAVLQALISFGLTDESYALTVNRIEKKGYNPYYQLCIHSIIYMTWVISSALGSFLINHIKDPLKWGVDFIIPASFLVLLVPRLVNKTSILVCIVSAVTAVLGDLFLPGKWYIIIACFAASISGYICERSCKNA